MIEPKDRKPRTGITGIRLCPTYRLWVHMKYRCKRGTRYEKNYAARGIKICSQWLNDYLQFAKDMGRRPTPGHSVDRVDNSRGYCPHNCRWATQFEQSMNSRMIKRKGSLPRWVTVTRSGSFEVKRTIKGKVERMGIFKDVKVAIKAARKLENL